MKILKFLDKNFEEIILMALLLVMTILMGAQIFSRYILRASLTWSEEITRYLFIWSAFLSIGYCARKKLGLRVDQLLTMLPKTPSKVVQIIALVIELLLFIHLFPFAATLLNVAVSTGRLSPAAQIPMWMMQAAPAVGFGLGVIRIGQRIVLELTGKMEEAEGGLL